MRQTLFMIAITTVGVVGAFTHGPAIAVAVYYFFAALRPQFMWEWALPQGVAWSQYVAVAAMAGTILWRLVATGAEAEPALRQGAAFRVFVAFAAWICLTYVTAGERDVAWPWFIEYLKIFVMFLIGAITLRTVTHVWTVFVLMTTALIYIAYEINVMYLFQGRLDVYNRGYGGLDNNGAGLMLAMGVPMAVYAWEGTSRWWRWLFLVAVPPMLHAVMMTYSRGAMLSLLLVVPIMVFRSRRRWPLAIATIMLAASVPMMAGQEIRDRFFSIQQYEEDDSANSRLDSWAAAIRIANDHPIVGVGIRNSNLLSYQYGADVQGRTIHSQYFQILADSGYPALILYLGMLLLLFVSLRHVRRALRARPPDDRRIPALASGAECGLLVFAVGGMFLSLEVFELPYALVLVGCQIIALQAIAAPIAARAAPAARAAARPHVERFPRIAGRSSAPERGGAAKARDGGLPGQTRP